jgi:hypothetical protein
MRWRAHRVVAVAVLAATTILIGAPSAHAQDEPVTMHATVDGQDVSVTARTEPIPLYPEKIADVVVDVTNHGQEPIEIASVQLVGRVLGLTFFSFVTGVDLTVAPGASGNVNYKLDLTELQHQATGLIKTEMIVRNRARDTVAVVHMVADVRGSLWSVYGLFGLALVVLTTLAIVDATIAIRRHQDSQNRWRRGLRMLTPGIGIGLVLAFSASVARWWVPTTQLWLLLAGGTAVTFFALGYFSPTPDDEDEDIGDNIGADEAEDEDAVAANQETMVIAVNDADKTVVDPFRGLAAAAPPALSAGATTALARPDRGGQPRAGTQAGGHDQRGDGRWIPEQNPRGTDDRDGQRRREQWHGDHR